MTPERIAAIREQHRPKPNYDYTDCGDCYQEYPCELVAALDMLAARDAQVAELCAAVRRAHNDRDTHIAIGQAFIDEINRLSGELAARDAQVAELTAALSMAAGEVNRLILSCATVVLEDGEPYTESDPSKFDCASFCENFGHHTLLEILALLTRTPAAPEGETVRADG